MRGSSTKASESESEASASRFASVSAGGRFRLWLDAHLHDICRHPLQMSVVFQEVSHIRNVINGMMASAIPIDDSANKRIQARIVNRLREVAHQIVICIQELRPGATKYSCDQL